MSKSPIEHSIGIDDYFDELDRWLELEAKAERERLARRRQIRAQTEVEKTGETLIRLQLFDHRTGLAGRLLLDFQKPGDQPLPLNRLKVGSPVVVSNDEDASDQGVPGVVSRRKQNSIQVATDVWPEGNRYRIDLSPDETTRRRQQAAMAKARLASGRTGKLRDTLLGKREPRFHDAVPFQPFTTLNPPQIDAVQFALSAKDGDEETVTLLRTVSRCPR